jgi:chemotaxis protein CheC
VKIEPHTLDALIEVANVGMSRAATQLSMLLNDRIEVTIPEIRIIDIEDVEETLNILAIQQVSCVTQQLQGQIDGVAMLLIHSSENEGLVTALANSLDDVTGMEFRAHEHEAVMEIGNIIISSSTAVMADMLGGEIALGVPDFIGCEITDLVSDYVRVEGQHDIKIVVMRANLEATERKVEGNFIIRLDENSLLDLFVRIDGFINEARS